MSKWTILPTAEINSNLSTKLTRENISNALVNFINDHDGFSEAAKGDMGEGKLANAYAQDGVNGIMAFVQQHLCSRDVYKRMSFSWRYH